VDPRTYICVKGQEEFNINFQECLGAWVRHCLVVAPSGMASHSSSSESQSFLMSWRVLIQKKVRVRSDPSTSVVMKSCKVGSSDVPKFPNALTMSSMESVASVFRIIQFDKSLGVHTWEFGAMWRSA